MRIRSSSSPAAISSWPVPVICTESATDITVVTTAVDAGAPFVLMYSFLHRFCIRLQMQMLRLVVEDVLSDPSLLGPFEVTPFTILHHPGAHLWR